MSMIQEAQQQMIRQCVSIDQEKGRAIAKLPFLTDPAGKLLDKEWLKGDLNLFAGSIFRIMLSRR